MSSNQSSSEKPDNKYVTGLKTGRSVRFNSFGEGTKKQKFSTFRSTTSLTNLNAPEHSPVRARSETPTQRGGPKQEFLFNGMDSVHLMDERLRAYGLDFVDDVKEHRKNIQDPNSKWFAKDFAPNYRIQECFPYKAENHQDQARYLCHILVNLYIAISSKDIQGLLNISSKELAQFKNDIDIITLNTDMFTLTDDASDIDDTFSSYDENQSDYDAVPGDEDAAEEGEEGEEEENEDAEPEFSHSGKITVRSSSIVNVHHWTNELRSCIHFDIPITLRKSLATVYYHLALVRGQKIFRQLHVEVFELLVDPNYEGVNYTKLLSRHGLVLDYKPMLALLQEYFPKPESDYQQYDISNNSQLKLFRMMLKHAYNASPLFDKNDETVLPYLMEYTLASFSPVNLSVISPIMTSLIPYHYNTNSNVTDLFPFIFSLWKTSPITTVLDTPMYEIIGDIGHDAYNRMISEENPDIVSKSNLAFGTFGLYNLDQMLFIFNRVQNHLRSDFKIASFSRTAKPFIYFINGSDHGFFFEQLALLVQFIETFIHPSNSGGWTKLCAKFIYALIKAYHERYIFEQRPENKFRSELKLNEQTHFKMIEIFIGPLMIGSQNKSSDVAHYYISSLAYLLNLKSSNSYKIFDKVLIDVYESLTDQYVNSIHRVFSSLKQFGRIARFMVMDELYRVHVSNILSMVVAKLDPNDPVLSNILVNTIASICSYIPIENFVKDDEYITFESATLPLIESHLYYIKDHGSSKGFSPEKTELHTAFRASTTVFETIFQMYVDKIFSFIDADLEAVLIFKMNQITMICIESMSDEIFDKFVYSFEKMFWNGDYLRVKSPNYDVLAITTGAIIKRDPKKYVPKFFNAVVVQINQELERGAGLVRSSDVVEQRDVKLVAMFNVLADLFRQSREELLPIKQDIVSLLTRIYTTITNPPIDIISSFLLHNILSSLTTTEIVEFRLFGRDTNVSIEEKWGGYQFNTNKYKKENIDFKWHVPNSDEIDFALELMELFLNMCQTELSQIMLNPTNSTKQTDTLKKFILILTHTLSGGCLLFDPEFNKELKEHEFTNKVKEKLLLWKNIKSGNVDDQLVDDETESNENEEDVDLYSVKNDTIEISHEDDVLVEECDSNVPSGTGTPVPDMHANGGLGGSMLLVNNDLTFRELSIYTTNYFFGSTRTAKFSDPRYVLVHKLRSDMGLVFHKLAGFLKDNYENNTNILQIFLHGLKVWFTDVGQETIFNEDPTSSLDFDFIEHLQSLSNIWDPFTRTCIASRIQFFYQARVNLRSTTRVPNKTEKIILNDIIHLSTSAYPDVAKPAQRCLLDTIKQLAGSYRYVIDKVIEIFEEALEQDNELKLESILSAISTKKMLSKIYSDFKNIKTIILLLFKASLLKHHLVSQTAEKILVLVVNNLKIPSSVCLIEMDKMQEISPKDRFIDSQVEIVIKAKEAKRVEYMDTLIDLKNTILEIFDRDEKVLTWRHSLVFIEALAKLQTSMEFDVDERVAKKLIEQTKQSHPSIILNATTSLMDVVNRIFTEGEIGYNIANKYDPNFNRKYIDVLDTKEANFGMEYAKEMTNFENPKFFIDNKSYVGYFTWGRDLNVVSPEKQVDISNLRESDRRALQNIGSLIDENYLKKYIEFLVSENESRGSFSHQNVDLFCMMINLIELGFIKSFGYSDILELCGSTFDKYDKSKIIMSAEIFCAIILSSKVTSDENLIKRDDFLNQYLDDLFNKNMNKDSLEVFQVALWWLPNHTDMRRCYPVFHKISSLDEVLLSVKKNKPNSAGKKSVTSAMVDDMDVIVGEEGDSKDSLSLDVLSPSSINARIALFRHMIMSMCQRTPNKDVFASKLVFDYPYELVRKGISRSIIILLHNDCMKPFACMKDMNSFILTNKTDGLGNMLKRIPKWFDDIFVSEMAKMDTIYAENFAEFEKMKPQEIIEHEYYFRANTMYNLLFDIVHSSVIPVGPYICKYFVPFLDRLYLMKDVCKLGNIYPDYLYFTLARSPMTYEDISDIVNNLLSNDTVFNTPHGIRLQMSFFENFYSSKIFLLKEGEKLKILDYFVSNLFNEKSLEVRIKSSEVLSGVIHTITLHDDEINGSKIISELISKFEKKLGLNLKIDEKKFLVNIKNPKNENIEVHGSIIGIGALIAAFPYVSPLPKWIPKQLSNLSSWARISGVCGTSSKDIISNFKKIRSDTWHIDRESFTSEELENLEGVNWRSYYA